MAFEQVFQRIKVKDLVKAGTIEAGTGTITRLVSGLETVSGSGASMTVSVTEGISRISMVGGAGTGTLADGVAGQRKTVVVVRKDGNFSLRPTNFKVDAVKTNIVFTGTGQAAELFFDGTYWQLVNMFPDTGTGTPVAPIVY